MKIKVLISNDDKFFTQGLTHLLSHYFNEKGILVEVSETLDANVHYYFAFIGANNLSQYLYARKMVSTEVIFIIQPDVALILNPPKKAMKILLRNQSVSTFLQQIDEVYLTPQRSSHIRQTLSLTLRENDVLHYYSIGYTNIEIGELLGIHQKTVSAHKIKAMNKLNFKHKGEFRRWLIETHCPQMCGAENLR
ncbi:response regulator transcription factor [Serratia fonticola]|uniref:response regulator transcription factor n=1 Tax=Serratia fonticola TaxID=47917 RepID=UPI0015C5B827|nr:LuxR C-terminal-related transcriptional regulator [Serratia fonticola]MBC3378237.1 response regulator transcription factor [Serratia fonticola]NYA37437.1 response regulator transcription factor [Serratia fonticola]